ncbi:hypothetical protein CIRG_03273 [Coccidioides immitis RMSCC 2394]|uniref:Uncharacterized protein n=1 Tax=Coccidioides immitis RMSCC 2394 TaxID=404692 RepID=A0A0J7B1B4_COCIT|nr:hypothetical protein CIRG_03273 [Coccidioides immitis RMSCC 2394]
MAEERQMLCSVDYRRKHAVRASNCNSPQAQNLGVAGSYASRTRNPQDASTVNRLVWAKPQLQSANVNPNQLAPETEQRTNRRWTTGTKSSHAAGRSERNRWGVAGRRGRFGGEGGDEQARRASFGGKGGGLALNAGSRTADLPGCPGSMFHNQPSRWSRQLNLKLKIGPITGKRTGFSQRTTNHVTEDAVLRPAKKDMTAGLLRIECISRSLVSPGLSNSSLKSPPYTSMRAHRSLANCRRKGLYPGREFKPAPPPFRILLAS